MNLRIPDGAALVDYLNDVVRRDGRSLFAGTHWRVLEADGRVFFVAADGSVEVGGPYRSVAHLIRTEGVVRVRHPGDDGAEWEICQWDGLRVRLEGESWTLLDGPEGDR